MTQQETFDLVVAHLREQNEQAMDGAICMYRARNGYKCAVGCLIPDNRYSPFFEKAPVCKGSVVGDLMSELGHDIPLLMRLQRVHDHRDVERWESGFREVAYEFDLKYQAP